MDKYIIRRNNKGIVWFTINRPEKRNAIDYEVMDGLSETISEVKNNQSDKVFVITGIGEKAFCSGGDLAAFQNLMTKEDAYKMLSKMGEILYSLATLEKPTVALLNGLAIGGGCELATACDYRLAFRESRFGFVQGRLGITTGWGGATLLLERVSTDKALQMLLTGNIYTAVEGKDLGYINHILSKDLPNNECEEYISKQIIHNTKVIEAYKKVVNRKWVATQLKQRMFREIEECSVLWASDEHHQAVSSFMNKNN
ncbi:enoyl-CoA hydratase/isomerase family protein [Fredinandcohnia humi]